MSKKFILLIAFTLLFTIFAGCSKAVSVLPTDTSEPTMEVIFEPTSEVTSSQSMAHEQ